MLLVALNDNAEHVEDGILMTDERTAVEWTPADDFVFLPKVVKFLERQSLILAQLVDEPDVLLVNLCRFHMVFILIVVQR